MTRRTEHDLLGERSVPVDALRGIHTLRATENFPLAGRPVRPALVHAYGMVKLACARANRELGRWDDATFAAIESACDEMIRGDLDEHVVVDALQGGAGTSTNMNVNEVLANRALVLSGRAPGEYEIVHPLEDINLHQSTNDTFPTALRTAAVLGCRELEREIAALQEAFQEKERAFAHIVKVGRTQMRDAVLTTLGREAGAWAEAIARDRWRVFKCEERLRVVNLGGTAIGTGICAPRRFIFRAVEHLREISGLGLARAENLVEATQNTDAFVEVSGILDACASNLLKICGDLRLLSSGPQAGFAEIRLPEVQAGSSIMPDKVNPVIPEAVSQAAMTVLANGNRIATACSLGSLELNAFLPLTAEALLESLDLLHAAVGMLRTRCVEGMEADEEHCRRTVATSTATATALVDDIGYEAASEAALEAKRSGVPLRDVVVAQGLLTAEAFDHAVSAERVMRLGSPDPDPSA